jgi:FkbM family methyltransferase
MQNNNDWYNSENIWKRRTISYYFKLKQYLIYIPLKYTGILLGLALGKTPIILASSIKHALKLKTKMPTSSLDIKVVVDRPKDHSRAQFVGKELLTCEWIEKYYKQGDTIYDIGANIGAVSLIAAAHLKKDCLIYAFEPLPASFNMLFKNIMINDFDNCIVPLNIALSDKVKIEKFNLTSIESGTSGHSIDGRESGPGHSRDRTGALISFSKNLTVLTQTLDNLIDSYNISQADHIKIDVDGIDYGILLGGEKTILNNPKLKTILIEKNNEEQIRDLLKKYGFVEVEFQDNKGGYDNMGFVRIEN